MRSEKDGIGLLAKLEYLLIKHVAKLEWEGKLGKFEWQ